MGANITETSQLSFLIPSLCQRVEGAWQVRSLPFTSHCRTLEQHVHTLMQSKQVHVQLLMPPAEKVARTRSLWNSAVKNTMDVRSITYDWVGSVHVWFKARRMHPLPSFGRGKKSPSPLSLSLLVAP